MYSSYLTRETFENEHDEKMTRKFSYNYQVLKRLFPEVYKLPESEIRSLVHSIYDNPKMGDELLDHLSDVINKKKPEWGEYLNPKPEEPVQSVQQDNPLQPVQPKPLNTGSGFEPYKPQKSAFGLGNSGGFGNAGGLGNSGGFGGLNNTNNFGNTGGLKQSQLPNFSKGMDLKHSDMVTGFGINEAKHKEMFGTGFQMPKLPKMPQFPKAPEPQTPELPQMPEISQTLHIQSMPQYPQIQLANSAYNNQPPMPPLLQQTPVPQRSFFNDYLMPEFKQDLSDIAYGANRTLNGMTFGGLDYLGNKFGVDTQMNSYLNTFSPEQQALRQIAGEMAQYGGAGLVLLDGGNAAYGALQVPYNAWRIGRAYDRLRDNPFSGSGQDIIAKMKDYNGDTVTLKQGEIIKDETGNPIVSGRVLKRATGTERNYGMIKAIRKHGMTRKQLEQIPRYVKRTPSEITGRNQDIYIEKTADGELHLVASPDGADKTISSYYVRTR